MFSVLKTPCNIRLSLSHCVVSVFVVFLVRIQVKCGKIRTLNMDTFHTVIRDNKDIAILSGDKDSSIVIMNKKDYNRKIEDMTNEGIQQGKYKKN